MKLKKYQEAIPYFVKYLKVHTSEPRTYLALAHCQMYVGQIESAKQNLEEEKKRFGISSQTIGLEF